MSTISSCLPTFLQLISYYTIYTMWRMCFSGFNDSADLNPVYTQNSVLGCTFTVSIGSGNVSKWCWHFDFAIPYCCVWEAHVKMNADAFWQAWQRSSYDAHCLYRDTGLGVLERSGGKLGQQTKTAAEQSGVDQRAKYHQVGYAIIGLQCITITNLT